MKVGFTMVVAGCHILMASVFAAEEISLPYLKWGAHNMPIVYYVNADAGAWPEGVGAIIRSFMSWESIPTAHIRFQYAGTSEKKVAEDDDENVVTWVSEGWPHGSDTLASAVLWLSPDRERIVGFDVFLNAEDFVWATDGDSQAMDVQNVATHELGHVLGLEHSVTSTAVTMFPVIVPGETRKRSVNEEERAVVSLLYPAGTTRVDTYSLSGSDAGFRPEAAVIDYPPAAESGTIFLLTRVDADGDGLDEVGIIQQEDGRRAFSLFPAVSSADPPRARPLAYDAWYIPGGNVPTDVTAVDMDGDGRQEIAVLRAEADGTYAAYIYDSPAPFSVTKDDLRDWVLRWTFDVGPGDNVVALVGLDYDRDGSDELGALRLTPEADYFLDIYSLAERENTPSGRVASISLGNNFWFYDLDASDIDGDEDPELIVLWKGNPGWYVSAFQLPDESLLPQEQVVSSLGTAPLSLPPGYSPIRLSSLRIAGSDGQPRPAICIVMGENR